MLMFTINEWYGPTRDHPKHHETSAKERLIGMASRLDVENALKTLSIYEAAFKKHYKYNAVNFTVLAINKIDDISDEVAQLGRIEIIENVYTDFVRTHGLEG
jgi:hypothetical protein